MCLASVKYSQTNTKLPYTPRKLIGGLTQQYAQPEPQNSAGTWHGEVDLGREAGGGQRAAFAGGKRTETGAGENTGKEPLPKSSWRKSGKLKTAVGTKQKGRKEKGERGGFKFH